MPNMEEYQSDYLEFKTCSNCKGAGKVSILEGFEDYDTEAACPHCKGEGGHWLNSKRVVKEM
jgi:DnaJ-class molecular chaperone